VPAITNEPADVTVNEYDAVTLSVTIDTPQAGTVYRWYMVDDGGTELVNTAATNTLTFARIRPLAGGHRYQCVVDVAGDGGTLLTSRTAKITVVRKTRENTDGTALATDFTGPVSQRFADIRAASPSAYSSTVFAPDPDTFDPLPSPDSVIGGGGATTTYNFWDVFSCGNASNTPLVSADYVTGGKGADYTFDFTPAPGARRKPGGGPIKVNLDTSSGTPPEVQYTGFSFSAAVTGPANTMLWRVEYDD